MRYDELILTLAPTLVLTLTRALTLPLTPNPKQEGALCYRSGEAGALEDPAYEQLVEKRIPLSSVLNVRVRSKE